MFFTREDILKIHNALLQLGVKDSELPSAEPVTYNDTLSIVQDGKNKQIGVKDFFNQISLWKREDFLNITDRYDEHYIMLLEAINLVPVLQRKDGLVITFQDTNGDWRIYQFRGNITEFLNEEKWFDLYDYKNYIIKSFLPDEEDITALTPDENGNSFLALKDRIYDPTIFSGKGYKFVRKNITNIELATIKISVINPTTLEGDIYFNINNKGTKVHLSPTIHNTTKLVSEAIKDALVIAYNDYEVTVANSVVTLIRKYSGSISPTTFEMYNTGVKVIVEDSTTINERNIITQEDINKADTIYEIRYDFNLDGKTIIIPKNCILYFTSGKFYNGSINMDNTIVSTLYEDVLLEVNISGNYYNIQKNIKDANTLIQGHTNKLNDAEKNIERLDTRSTQMEETIKDIAATGGASQATAVTYNNEKSKLTAVNIQSAVDEVVDKTAIKNEEGTVVETPFRYIQNEEFIFAKVDAEDKLLFGIQWDGTPVFGKTSAVEDRLQSQVTLLAEKVATIMGDEDATNVIDTINELKDFFANIDNTQTLTSILANLNSISTKLGEDIKNLQDTKVDKEEGKSLIEDEVKECFRVIENEEFIHAVIDSESRLLFGIYRDSGKPYLPQNDMYHISQSEEFLWVILDAVNHPLLGIQQDGTCWAAKAQWLDDIKAIKKAISSIDETLKIFQPKEDGKGLINLDVADSFFYISNDEYIIAVVDAENRILAGIKYDGEPYFPNHEMYSVITNEEWLYAIIDAENKILGGFRANDGHLIVGGIDISTFISDAIIDISDIKERTAHLYTMDNDEYLSVETDADGKVIGYTAPDGSHYLYKVKSETIPEEFEHIEDPEGRTEITTDAEGKILGYREKDGTRYEHKQKVENMSVNHFSNLSETACQDIVNSLSAYGLTLENKLDFSDNIDIFIPIPRGVAVVNIIADSLATSKTQNKDAVLEFWGSGIYFRKNIILNAQGQTSIAFAKKNQSFDFKDGTSIKFGDWVSQDSFHLKANADDVFCGLNNIVYKYADYVVGKTDTRANRVLRSATISYQNASGKFKADFDDNAKCMPDGFPISLHLNGEFYGMYTWNMKKHRANYSMDKKDYTSIMIDPDRLTSETFWNGTIDWSKFELKNPKTLICMDGSKYDGDNPKELIDSTSEKYDESNKDMKNTAITKSLLVSLSNAMPAINALSNNEEKKAKFKELFDYDNLVVYFLVSNAIGNYDGLWGRNTVFTIYNSGKCGFNFYDCNAVFGREARGWYAIKPNEIEKAAGTPFEMLDVLFHTEIANEYAKLRTSNLISTDTICTFLQDWLSTIGAYSISKNLDKWNEIPSYRDGSKTYPSYPTTNGFYDSFQRCEKWVKERISFMDNYFNYNV